MTMPAKHCVWLLIAAVFSGASTRRAAAQGDAYIQKRALYVEEAVNRTPDFQVRVNVDRADRIYSVDDLVTVTVRSRESGYLYLVYVQANGETVLLFPNKHHEDNQIPALQDIVVPADGSGFQLRVGEPTGKELLKAIVTTRPLTGAVFQDARTKSFTPVDTNTERELLIGGTANLTGAWAEHHVEITTRSENAPAAAPRAKRRVALCVGVSEYNDNRIRDLTLCDGDATAFAEMLRSQCGFDDVQMLTNEKATRKAIETAVRTTLAEQTRPHDDVVIYWSGHGSRIADDDGDESDSRDEVLIPHDAEIGSTDKIRQTTISDDVFGRWIQELDGRRVVMILDTCHAGGGGRTGQKKGAPTQKDDTVFLDHQLAGVKELGQHGTALLASSLARQVSYKRKQGDLSVMTHFIVDYVRKSPDPVTLSNLHVHLAKHVPPYVESRFEGVSRSPVLINDIRPDFLLKP
jgi:hypothetical protein